MLKNKMKGASSLNNPLVGTARPPEKSQVPKRVVSKRVVLADVPLYRHFIFLTFWFFLRFGSSALSPSPEGGDPDQVFSLN